MLFYQKFFTELQKRQTFQNLNKVLKLNIEFRKKLQDLIKNIILEFENNSKEITNKYFKKFNVFFSQLKFYRD